MLENFVLFDILNNEKHFCVYNTFKIDYFSTTFCYTVRFKCYLISRFIKTCQVWINFYLRRASRSVF